MQASAPARWRITWTMCVAISRAAPNGSRPIWRGIHATRSKSVWSAVRDSRGARTKRHNERTQRMDQPGTRALTGQLAEDLGWLEEHCRRHPEQVDQAVPLRLATALVRNCLGPLLDEQPPVPLHIAVIGGAGAGKSTVANFLSGGIAAEANPQAGFTRHPIAYTSANGTLHWAGHLGFLGPLQRLAQ